MLCTLNAIYPQFGNALLAGAIGLLGGLALGLPLRGLLRRR